MLAGRFIVVGALLEEEEYSFLPEDMIDKYTNLFKDPVCEWRYVLYVAVTGTRGSMSTRFGK